MAILTLPLWGRHYENAGYAMLDQDKSKQELIEELAEMRRRVAVLETADADRKLAEEKLQNSERTLRTLMDSGNEGIPIVRGAGL